MISYREIVTQSGGQSQEHYCFYRWVKGELSEKDTQHSSVGRNGTEVGNRKRKDKTDCILKSETEMFRQGEHVRHWRK